MLPWAARLLMEFNKWSLCMRGFPYPGAGGGGWVTCHILASLSWAAVSLLVPGVPGCRWVCR